jgi:hypothetical protein
MATADLRPMTLGEVLDRTFKLYFANFWLFSGIMCFPFLILFVFNVGVGWVSSAELTALRAGQITPSAAIAIAATSFAGVMFLILISFIVTGVGQAATIFAVSDIYLGKMATIRNSFQQIRGHILQALGTIFIVALAVGAGFICLVIPGIVIGCRTSVAIPAAMLENLGAGAAFSRSMDLTRGFATQAFLVFLLCVSIATGVSSLFTMPFMMMQLLPKPHQLPFGMIVLQDACAFVGSVLASPLQVIAFSLMYYNLRVRKEGFDLEHLMGSLEPPSSPSLPATDAALPS